MSRSKLQLHAPRSRRSRFQHLESRQMLAADAIDWSMIAEMVAADVNADGAVSAVDALQVINQLNAVERPAMGESSNGPRRMDVSGDGRVTALDALQVINRLDLPNPRIVDSVLSMVPTVDHVAQESIESFVDELLRLRLETDLPARPVGELIRNMTTIARDAHAPTGESVSRLVSSWRVHFADRVLDQAEVDVLLDRVGEVISSAGGRPEQIDSILGATRDIIESIEFDREGVRTFVAEVQAFVTSLPDNFQDLLGDVEIDPDVEITVNEILAVLDGASSPLALPMILRDFVGEDVEIRFPNWRLLGTFVGNYVAARSDDVFTPDERDGLATDADALLASAGVSDALRAPLIEAFRELLR